METFEKKFEMEKDIDNLEKIIKEHGFMAVKENETLEKLYEEVKKSDLNKLIYDNEKIKDSFFRGRLFKEDMIEKENNESNQCLSFVQPPLKVKLSIARFNHINNSYFYISDNKYAPYFELEKYKKENKEKELFVQEYRLANQNLNLLDTNKIDNFIRSKLSLPINTFDVKNRSLLSDNYNVSNFFLDLFKSNKNTNFSGVLYSNKKSFDIFLKEKNSFIYETDIINDILLYQNITFFSDYWSYETIKLKDLYEINSTNIKNEDEIKKFTDSKINELTGKAKEKCVEASTFFELIGQPKKIDVKEIIIETFNLFILKKKINYHVCPKLFLKCFISCNFKELLISEKMKINDFFKVELKYTELKFSTPNDDLLSFDVKRIKNSIIENSIKFKYENNQITFENQINGKKILLDYILDIFEYFFGIYYKLELKSDEILLIKQE